MEDKIYEIIESIRPMIQDDGGDIEFIEYKDNIVYVSVSGMCMHCYMINITLEQILNTIKEEVDEVKDIKIV